MSFAAIRRQQTARRAARVRNLELHFASLKKASPFADRRDRRALEKKNAWRKEEL